MNSLQNGHNVESAPLEITDLLESRLYSIAVVLNCIAYKLTTKCILLFKFLL